MPSEPSEPPSGAEAGPSVAIQHEQRAMEMEARVAQLERSMIEHFQRDHLEGDGPQIDRWKRRLRDVYAELGARTDRLNEATERLLNQTTLARALVEAVEECAYQSRWVETKYGLLGRVQRWEGDAVAAARALRAAL